MTNSKSQYIHIKAILIGGGVCGIIGALLGYLAGFTLEGAGAGFVIGWIVGEIFGLASVSNGE